MYFEINDKELFANLLCAQMEERCDKEDKIEKCDNLDLKKEAESDRLFYWLLSTLYRSADSQIPAKRHTMITIKSQMLGKDIMLNHKNFSQYLPTYVQGKDFLDVVKDTLKFLDRLDRYSVLASEITEDKCEFSIWF